MRIGWVGFHMEALLALRAVLEAGYNVVGVITLRPEKAAKRSGWVEYDSICKEFGVPLYKISNINDPDAVEMLRSMEPDIVFVLGWSQIIRPEALSIPRIGMIGAHASLLPHNRGSAPINWALIKGEKSTGNSLIWLAEEVDSGHIIAQRSFEITPYDTCGTLYDKVAETNREMAMEVLPKLSHGERPGYPQPHTNEPLLSRRRPRDGEINWRQDAKDVYNFIRALTHPYPGAFSWLDGEKWYVWQSALLPREVNVEGKAGEIVGPVYSPVSEACGQLVACETGGVILLDVESSSGVRLRGRQLSEQPWQGKVWKHAK